VTGALWDIYDNANDGFDQYSDGFEEIWDTLNYETYDRFFWFWLGWKDRGHNKHDAVRAIYQNTIDYDAPPTISGLPDRRLPMNFSWNNAIDLWFYASDAESADWQLSYTIVGNTDPNCGVSIDSLGYVDINPAHDWLGSSEVTIQVSDGLKTGTDTFMVETYFWVPTDFVYLPIIVKNH